MTDDKIPTWPVFEPGQVVEANPDTGAYSKGDRYGTVIGIEAGMVAVRMVSGKVRLFHPQRITMVRRGLVT